MFLDYFALFLLVFVAVVIFYGVIVIHDIPYEIAKHRKHPHQDAILVAGWVSLLTLHIIWPFLWIWATLYQEDRGWGFDKEAAPGSQSEAPTSPAQELAVLRVKVERLEQQLNAPALRALVDGQQSSDKAD